MDKKLTIKSTALHGLTVVEPKVMRDNRGAFYRVFCQDELAAHLSVDIKQINHSYTKHRGSVRGLHFQYEPNAEIKLVSCLVGAVYDVVVDIRKNSPTFLQHFTIELSAQNKKMLCIPKGFAHGFQTLVDDTSLLYCHSASYTPDNEGGLNVTDPLLDISWPLGFYDISTRDTSHPMLNKDFQGIRIDEM